MAKVVFDKCSCADDLNQVQKAFGLRLLLVDYLSQSSGQKGKGQARQPEITRVPKTVIPRHKNWDYKKTSRKFENWNVAQIRKCYFGINCQRSSEQLHCFLSRDPVPNVAPCHCPQDVVEGFQDHLVEGFE